MQDLQLSLFDYNSLDKDTRFLIEMRTIEIKGLMKRAAEDIIEIGQKLIEVKATLGHGKFGDWLSAEFTWSQETAQRFMRVAKNFNQIRHGDGFEAKALYLLSSPSTPEPARVEAITRAEAGETITYSKAKDIVDWNKSEVKKLVDDYNETRETFFAPRPQPTHQPLPVVQQYDEWVNEPDPPYEVEDQDEKETEDTAEPELEEFMETVYEAPQRPLPPPPIQIPTQVQPQAMTLLTSSNNDSWRTPSRYLAAAREVLNGIDLDPASSSVANIAVGAMSYFTKKDDGLAQPWIAGTVWINPPYGKTNNKSNQGLFAQKLVDEYEAGNVGEGIILVNLYVGYDWWAPLRTLPMCLLDHRISFVNPDTNLEGDEAKASSVFIYVGKDPRKFYRVFKQFGPCGQFSYDWE